MTAEELAEIRARAEAATPGPWTVESCGCCVYDVGDEADAVAQSLIRVNSKFIAHAREDVPALVAEIERLRAALGHARGTLVLYNQDGLWDNAGQEVEAIDAVLAGRERPTG